MSGKERVYKAVIQFGAISLKILIFRMGRDGKLFQVNLSQRITNLGEDLENTGLICEDAISRNMEALDEFLSIAQDYHVESFYLYGTSALRNAANAEEFLLRVHQRCGLPIEVISGQVEARYEFLGVSQCFDGEVLLFNIGERVMRLLYGRQSVDHLTGLSLGSRLVTTRYFRNDPPSPQEIKTLFDFSKELIGKRIKEFDRRSDDFHLAGNGALIQSLALIRQRQDIFDERAVHNRKITRSDLELVIRKLLKTRVEDRRELPGLQFARASQSVAAAVLAYAMLEAVGRDSFTVCGFDKLQGAAFLTLLSPEEQMIQIHTYR